VSPQKEAPAKARAVPKNLMPRIIPDTSVNCKRRKKGEGEVGALWRDSLRFRELRRSRRSTVDIKKNGGSFCGIDKCVGVMFDQKRPVAAPGNVTGHHTES
jgi:hypothetical protein